MLNHQGTRILKTERLCLRPFQKGDAEPMFMNWANDPEVTRYLTWDAHRDITITRAVITLWAAGYTSKNTYNWAIVLDGEPIGSIGFVRQDDEAGEAEVGYCLGKAFWGRGYTPEALGAVMSFAFDEVGFQNIVARHDIRNKNSGKVMIKCGMRYVKTQHDLINKAGETIIVCDYYEKRRAKSRR